MKQNYRDAWQYVKDLIDYYIGVGTLPLHQGTCDIAGVLDFHDIAETANLTTRQYNQLINKAQAYTVKQIKNTYYKEN